jgi:DNA-binding PadR family transcriptional regulator
MDEIQLSETGLLILSQMRQPIHGYDIMKRIEHALSPGFKVGPATMYTTLAKLVELKLCSIQDDQNRKVYRLSELGERVLADELRRRKRLLEFMTQRVKENA